MAVLSPLMLQMLVCPEDKMSLEYIATEEVLYNPRTAKVYEIKDGIPVLLIDEARSADEAERSRYEEIMKANASQTTGPKESK